MRCGSENSNFEAAGAWPGYLATGQATCHDLAGHAIPCGGSGQDAEYRRGIPWPQPRHERQEETVLDRLTGLVWTRDANPGEFPMTWQEALDHVARMNRACAFGYGDWRLPNRRELRSLVSHQTRKPALPEGHPFLNVFPGWYWSATTAAIGPAHAWYVHMEGARMFYGGKDQSFLLWPVRGMGNGAVPATGQALCYDAAGREISCLGSGQDGELHTGRPWPQPRFAVGDESVLDHLTGLCWQRDADITRHTVNWDEALAAVAALNRGASGEMGPWRLPNINELESLVDCARHSPALPSGHPFEAVQAAYWSATTSAFEPDWAWALYLDQGAVGVGQKRGRHFHVWAVRDSANDTPVLAAADIGIPIAALPLNCPAPVPWGLFITRPGSDEPAVHTHGMTMNWVAPFYDLYCRAAGLGQRFRDQTLQAAAIRAGEAILDVGCGTGVLTRRAAEAAGPTGSAVGIDPAPDMVHVARENARRQGSRAEFKVAAIEQLPFEHARFDVVLASLMLHHLPPDVKRQGLREAYRVLKPGGRLVVADFCRPAQPLWWLVAWPFLFMHMTADNLRGTLPDYFREAGFDPVAMRGRRAGILAFWTAIKPGEKTS